MSLRHRSVGAYGAVLCGLLAALPSWGAGMRALVAPAGPTGVAVEILLSYDSVEVDTDARQYLAETLDVPIGAIAEPVQALFSAGLVLTWNPAVVSFQAFGFDPASPATFQFTCPEADPGCEDFDETPGMGRMAFGIGIAHFDGILTGGEERVGTLSFLTLGPGSPAFALGVDDENQFANAPRVRLLDVDTLLGIDLCTGQPVPDANTAPCEDSLAFASAESVGALAIETHYAPEPHALPLALVSFAALGWRSGVRARAAATSRASG